MIANKIIRSKRKTIAIEMTPYAEIIVRAPEKISTQEIEKLINGKSDWIVEKTRGKLINSINNDSFKIVDGEEILFLGNAYRIKKTRDIQIELDNFFKIPNETETESIARIKNWYFHQATKILNERSSLYIRKLGLEDIRIKINSAKKRLGSCGVNNGLNFSWRLIIFPLRIVDYVVIHELMHIEEKNHSQAFWKKIGIILPDFKKRKEWLSSNQKNLMRYMNL